MSRKGMPLSTRGSTGRAEGAFTDHVALDLVSAATSTDAPLVQELLCPLALEHAGRPLQFQNQVAQRARRVETSAAS